MLKNNLFHSRYSNGICSFLRYRTGESSKTTIDGYME